MMMSDTTKSNGFTLFEVLLYVALFGIIFVTILQYATTIAIFNVSARDRTAIGKQVLFINEHIRDSTDTANAIEEAQTVFRLDNGAIQFTTAAGTLRYRLQNGNLLFFDGTDEESITDPYCRADRFYIEPIRNADTELIGFRLQMTITTRSDRPESQSFEATYLLGVLQ